MSLSVAQPLERCFNNYYFIIQGGCVRFPKTPRVCTGSETAEGSLSVSSGHSKFSVSRLACDIIADHVCRGNEQATEQPRVKESAVYFFFSWQFPFTNKAAGRMSFNTPASPPVVLSLIMFFFISVFAAQQCNGYTHTGNS